jgi:hypothetical protein
LKTSLLSSLILILIHGAPAFAFNEFECLRDMLPVTAHGAFQSKRKGVEQPFMLDDRHMVFPEVRDRRVTGFFLYDSSGAWYFDAVQATESGEEPISALNQKGKVLYQMVAQPKGLETVTIFFMPGFDAKLTNQDGPVMLGASVLPVVGAFVSRPEKTDWVYQNPKQISEDELKNWVHRNMGGRKPASPEEIVLSKKIVKLRTKTEKAQDALYAPLKNELSLREKWVESRNLDDQTFRNFNRVLQTTCNRTRP